MVKPFTSIVAVALALWVGGANADDHERMHRHLPKDIDAFHSLLAPLWHARPGQERLRNACAQATEMETLAKNIQSADAAPLASAVSAFKGKCQANANDLDAALFDVHEAFHRLIEAPAAAR
jgi:hypothetical protein